MALYFFPRIFTIATNAKILENEALSHQTNDILIAMQALFVAFCGSSCTRLIFFLNFERDWEEEIFGVVVKSLH